MQVVSETLSGQIVHYCPLWSDRCRQCWTKRLQFSQTCHESIVLLFKSPPHTHTHIPKGIISAKTTKRNMYDMAMIYNTPADRRIWHPNVGSQVLQVPISVSREITLQEEHLCCQKIVICGFNGVLKCNDPRWSRVWGEK